MKEATPTYETRKARRAVKKERLCARPSRPSLCARPLFICTCVYVVETINAFASLVALASHSNTTDSFSLKGHC